MNQTAKQLTEIESSHDWQLERMIPGSGLAMQAHKTTILGEISRRTKRNPFRDYWGRTLRGRSAPGDRLRRKALIVGAGPIGHLVAEALREEGRTELCGFLDDRFADAPQVLGRIEDLPRLARAEFIDEVIVALPAQSEAAKAACELARHHHLDVRTTIVPPEGFWPEATVDRVCQVPVINLHRESFPRGRLCLKRVLDIAGAILGLVCLAPLMAVLAILIRLDSRGPAIYGAERVGERGRRFPCYKFRSMVQDADRLKEGLRSRNRRQGPIFKVANDPRITRVGRFIRRHSLDELPQLWNVLRGDMSLVGPRPHPVEDVMRYDLQHYQRLDMKPGMTGLWQVTARRNSSFELAMHLDITYIENWTLLLDLHILMLTFRELLFNGD